jgi:hypothetical protein
LVAEKTSVFIHTATSPNASYLVMKMHKMP